MLNMHSPSGCLQRSAVLKGQLKDHDLRRCPLELTR